MDAREVLGWLERRGTRRNVQAMARYGIVAPRAYGVTVGTLIGLAKRLGKDHALAAALWESGWYEARLLAPMVDDPGLVTRRQMNAWAGDFDNWAVSWALRAIGRRNLALHGAALALAGRLAASGQASCRWIGQDARRDLAKPQVRAQVLRRGRPSTG